MEYLKIPLSKNFGEYLDKYSNDSTSNVQRITLSTKAISSLVEIEEICLHIESGRIFAIIKATNKTQKSPEINGNSDCLQIREDPSFDYSLVTIKQEKVDSDVILNPYYEVHFLDETQTEILTGNEVIKEETIHENDEDNPFNPAKILQIEINTKEEPKKKRCSVEKRKKNGIAFLCNDPNYKTYRKLLRYNSMKSHIPKVLTRTKRRKFHLNDIEEDYDKIVFHKCGHCAYKTMFQSAMNLHYRSLHCNESNQSASMEIYACPQCVERSFDSIEKLIFHFAKEHPSSSEDGDMS